MAWPSTLSRTKDWGTEVLTDSDLEGQLDLIITYVNDMMDASTGHKHDGTTSEGPKILMSNLDGSVDDQGEIYYSDGTNIVALGVGSDGQFLKTQGAAANPAWATVNADQSQDGSVVQVVNVTDGALNSGATTIPFDDTIPQNTEGNEFMTLAITPKSATNILKIDVGAQLSDGHDNARLIMALFQDSTADALAAVTHVGLQASWPGTYGLDISHYMVAGTTSETTFKVRAGGSLGTCYFNGDNGGRNMGGVSNSYITITEIKAS